MDLYGLLVNGHRSTLSRTSVMAIFMRDTQSATDDKAPGKSRRALPNVDEGTSISSVFKVPRNQFADKLNTIGLATK